MPAKPWVNDIEHFWGDLKCDGLFLLFDTSAYANGGVPDIEAQEVLDHIRECGTCQEEDVRVSDCVDGCYLEV